MKQKHILVVSQYFYPEAFRINDMCCEWVKRGYKVTVLTGIPNYPQGKFYKGYGWFKKRREIWNGIDIVRIPLIARGHSSIGMVLNYLSFVVSGFFWKCFTHLKPDCVFNFETSPMTQVLIGVWFAKRRKIPCYAYIQDLWPENVETVTGIHSRAVIGPIEKMVNYIYKRCDKIFATSPSFVKDIQKRLPEGEQDKVLYWPQYAEEFYCPMEKKAVPEIPDDGNLKIVFTGNIGQAQGLDVLPRTAKLLLERGQTSVRFVIVGDGRRKKQLLDDIAENGVEELFVMVDRQPAERIPELLAACDVAFISFMDTPLFANTIPAKLQSYMACGMPILAAAIGETERIVAEAGCGYCCGIGDEVALADRVENLMQTRDFSRLSEASLSYFDSHFKKSDLMDYMDTFFEKEKIEEEKQEQVV